MAPDPDYSKSMASIKNRIVTVKKLYEEEKLKDQTLLAEREKLQKDREEAVKDASSLAAEFTAKKAEVHALKAKHEAKREEANRITDKIQENLQKTKALKLREYEMDDEK